MIMATTVVSSTTRQTKQSRSRRLSRFLSRCRLIFRSIHPAWLICFFLITYILFTSREKSYLETFEHLVRPADVDEERTAKEEAQMFAESDSRLQRRMNLAVDQSTTNSTTYSLGNHFCILQPTLSSGKSTWTDSDARNHIALRAFMRTFATTVTQEEKKSFQFSIYYGHDSDDPVFGEPKLQAAFSEEARSILRKQNFKDETVKFVFTPLYGLHGRINAIWNMLAKDAYYDGCDYFFLSNDDMVFFTPGWVSIAHHSLNGIGAPPGHKRPCRYFGIVRFKDEWANWATFTFHVSTRMHMEIFDGVYYPVPYNSAHNDYWINFVYSHFDASKFRGEVKVRNRVEDVEYALAHPKDKSKIAPPRYLYDKRGNARKYILQGRARTQAWLDKYKHTSRCPPPL